MIRTEILTHVETLQLAAIGVKCRVVEVGELFCNSVDVTHGDHRRRWAREEKRT